ncbi:F0F1 ATP synthase subunit A [Thermosipho africanus H17ap60334]|jgi:F-type H+-transporting ATPase subunit a|uniref:ATP synthase subunit a n=1 Tax=Thermosipho africanus (strain TCF52B) TaxID=484019 RepID=B7IG38_THEAB|nr:MULTISPECIES: F0F1 ATP synthase subunit A [Thermosipho]HCF38935.1 F0F1 ATP synthase subunit A [Thermosipho africanus]ACJ75052.1 ATP synthase F0, A subunit [Thermosipho africanus TCF52B]EKF50222.1 F0F1 ATP synthase subunit A [Thermosipho africanus H17ap60334]MBZ4649500.1 atpB [Thermosipho sp. (in: thermotogales)]MDK2838817.1 F-type H+-transporting ATPase subunit a [Thermosipho sp. (in: thermotogales)]
MKKKISTGLLIFLIIYTVVGIINAIYFVPKDTAEVTKGLANRWIVQFSDTKAWYTRINPLTLIMSWAIIIGLIIFAVRVGKNFKVIPDRKQALSESVMDFMYEVVESVIDDPKFVKPTFMIATTLFIYISIANVIGGAIPGINVSVVDGHVKFTLFQDTWFSPTADLNTNLTYALMVFVISHAFAIKAKGFGGWLKSWMEPTPIMLPMNIIGELAKPISHSLRLFGNIGGGAILTFMLSYLVKYLFMPVVFWGYFGMFVGLVQALVFSMLAVAYISEKIS